MVSRVGLVGPVRLHFRYRSTEVRVTPFEGKRIPVRFFRINEVEQAQDETKQAILKQEDARLLVILQAAVTDYMYEWRDVVGWEGLYQVRGDGAVKSLPRQTRKGVSGGRILKQSPDSSGHLQVTLSRSGLQVKAAVHRLVAAAFIGECPPGKEACHGPLGQQVNWVTNLRYDTHASNMADRRRAGRYANAEKTECPRCDGPYTVRRDGKGRYCAPCNSKKTVERRRSNKRAA
jgi:hypothetical protein